MPPRVTLTYQDETGSPHVAFIQTKRFAIGRSPDNDLTISNSNLSRQHAVIESFNNLALISDCGSRNGTTVNGQPVTSAVELYDGDVITLGGACHLIVKIQPANETGTADGVVPTHVANQVGGAGQTGPVPAFNIPPSNTKPFWRTPPVMVSIAGIGLILLVAGVLIALSLRDGGEKPPVENSTDRSGSGEVADSRPIQTKSEETITPDTPNKETGHTQVEERAVDDSGASSPNQISRAAKQVMGRISTDSTPFISSDGVKDVEEKVNAYRGSATLREKIRAMQRGCAEIKALAQDRNLKPALVMYAALAQSESGNDPVAVARQMLPKLLTLRATFGTETANSSLLLVAAYPYPFNPPIGSQTRTQHPLAAKLIELGGRKSVEDTSVARSVWFLREKNGITPEAYNLVIRLLAIGIIAHDPHRYGIDADPLLC